VPLLLLLLGNRAVKRALPLGADLRICHVSRDPPEAMGRSETSWRLILCGGPAAQLPRYTKRPSLTVPPLLHPGGRISAGRYSWRAGVSAGFPLPGMGHELLAASNPSGSDRELSRLWPQDLTHLRLGPSRSAPGQATSRQSGKDQGFGPETARP